MRSRGLSTPAVGVGNSDGGIWKCIGASWISSRGVQGSNRGGWRYQSRGSEMRLWGLATPTAVFGDPTTASVTPAPTLGNATSISGNPSPTLRYASERSGNPGPDVRKCGRGIRSSAAGIRSSVRDVLRSGRRLRHSGGEVRKSAIVCGTSGHAVRNPALLIGSIGVDRLNPFGGETGAQHREPTSRTAKNPRDRRSNFPHHDIPRRLATGVDCNLY